MPAKRTAKKAESAESIAEPAAGSAVDDTPAAPSAAEPAPVDGDEPDGEVEQVPMNRAERRAKGKGGAASQPTSRGKVVGGKGPASTQRMWANRRSG